MKEGDFIVGDAFGCAPRQDAGLSRGSDAAVGMCMAELELDDGVDGTVGEAFMRICELLNDEIGQAVDPLLPCRSLFALEG